MTKILIVEDDATIARVYRGLIRMTGADVTVAADGELAIEALAQSTPDLVLLDLMLPKKNGVEVLRHIRSTPELKDIPVVVFSNACMGEMLDQANQAGATRCLVKAETPPKQLIDTLQSILADRPPAPSIPSPNQPLSSIRFASEPDRAHSQTSAGARLSGEGQAIAGGSSRTSASAVAELVNCAQAMLSRSRAELQSLAKTESAADRTKLLGDLHRAMGELSLAANSSGLHAMGQMAGGLEKLIHDLKEDVSTINASSIRTAAQGLDRLDTLLSLAMAGTNIRPQLPIIFVLDDDAICRRLVATSLERAGLRCIKVDDPNVGLRLLQENSFQLAFLDVMMPGIDGFEVCKRLRATSLNQKTPVVFVTSLSDLETRAMSILSGGNDFIGKPYLPSELIVKALVHLLAPKLPTAAASPSVSGAAPRPTAASTPAPATATAPVSASATIPVLKLATPS